MSPRVIYLRPLCICERVVTAMLHCHIVSKQTQKTVVHGKKINSPHIFLPLFSNQPGKSTNSFRIKSNLSSKLFAEIHSSIKLCPPFRQKCWPLVLTTVDYVFSPLPSLQSFAFLPDVPIFWLAIEVFHLKYSSQLSR